MNKTVNIAFLLGRVSERGGISRVTSIIASGLIKKENLIVHIISYQKREDNGYEWPEDLIFHNLIDKRWPMKWGMWPAIPKLRKIITANKIDILICSGHIVGPLGVFGALMKRTKLVYWSHSSFLATTSNKYRVFNEKFTALFSDKLISLTKTDLINYRKFTKAKEVGQIYNPVDEKLFKNEKSYSLNSKKIISAGRLTEQKNFTVAVDIAELVLGKHQDWEWHIYGSGTLEAEIQKKITEKKLNDRMILKGQSNRLYELYSEYSILVMTSKYEGFPMTLIEGMAKKLPLVSFDIPTGPREIVFDGKNGYLIKPFDVVSMAEKINHLIESENTRKRFSQANIDLIDNFKLEHIISKWIRTFEELMV